MTDELREKIANIINEVVNDVLSPLEHRNRSPLEFADQILSIIDSHFPQLAKERGYVKLAEEQATPIGLFDSDNYELKKQINLIFLKASWRKVVLE